jgi:hypothetical protein
MAIILHVSISLIKQPSLGYDVWSIDDIMAIKAHYRIITMVATQTTATPT